MNVTLLQSHNHNGIELPAGASVDLPEDVAGTLLLIGKAVALAARTEGTASDEKDGPPTEMPPAADTPAEGPAAETPPADTPPARGRKLRLRERIEPTTNN